MDQWTKIISVGVGPIIVISACGLLCLALYNRLAAIVARLRAFHREQLHEHEALAELRRIGSDDEAIVRRQEVLGMIQVQIGRVVRRARLIRRALGCLLLTIALLAACSLAIGLGTVVPEVNLVAVMLFVAGLLLLIGSVVLAMLELRIAVEPVDLEGRFIEQMAEDLSEQSPDEQVRDREVTLPSS